MGISLIGHVNWSVLEDYSPTTIPGFVSWLMTVRMITLLMTRPGPALPSVLQAKIHLENHWIRCVHWIVSLATLEILRQGYVLRDVLRLLTSLQTMARQTVLPGVPQEAMLTMFRGYASVSVQANPNRHLLTTAPTSVWRYVQHSLTIFQKTTHGHVWMSVRHRTTCMLTIRQGSVCTPVLVTETTHLLITRPGCVLTVVQMHQSRHSTITPLRGVRRVAPLAFQTISPNSVSSNVQTITMVRP